MILLHSLHATCKKVEKLFKYIQGPMVRTWFVILERLFGPTVTLRKTLQKVALDQFAFAPCSQMTILSSVGLMQGFSFEMIKDKLHNELFTIMKTGWKVN